MRRSRCGQYAIVLPFILVRLWWRRSSDLNSNRWRWNVLRSSAAKFRFHCCTICISIAARIKLASNCCATLEVNYQFPRSDYLSWKTQSYSQHCRHPATPTLTFIALLIAFSIRKQYLHSVTLPNRLKYTVVPQSSLTFHYGFIFTS